MDEMNQSDVNRLEQMVALIKTQENYATADPIYLVQRGEWVPLHDDYKDDADGMSVRNDFEGEEATSDEAAYVLKLYHEREEIPSQFRVYAMKRVWETVGWHLTEASAKAHRDGYPKDEYRVYVESGHRSNEIRFIRRILPLLLDAVKGTTT